MIAASLETTGEAIGGGGAAAATAGAGESPPPRAFNIDMRALLGSGDAGVGGGRAAGGAAAAGCVFSLVEDREGGGPKRSDSASTAATG